MQASIIGDRIDPDAVRVARDRLLQLAERRGLDLSFVAVPESERPAVLAGHVDRILAELAFQRDHTSDPGAYRAALAVLRRAIGSRRATGLHIDSAGAVFAMW